MSATVVIATRSRRDELRGAIRSAVEQSAKPEVLVMDDGSTDGTCEMVAREFPGVRLHRTQNSIGYIAQRNRGAQLACGRFIVSIDDDAAFASTLTVEQALRCFDDPRVGAVAIPYIDVRQGPEIKQEPPDNRGIYVVHSYVGTAHALRRDVFIALGGYRAQLMHQGEESDYCIRMLSAGYVVRLVRADPVLHFESPKRDFKRIDMLGRRNDVLFAWHNVPWPRLPLHLAATAVNGLVFGIKNRRAWNSTVGLARGLGAALLEIQHRKPVTLRVYRLSRMLKKRGPRLLSDVEASLPARWVLEPGILECSGVDVPRET